MMGIPKREKSKLVRVRADSLQIHPIAQRELVQTRLKKMVAELDLDAISVLDAVEGEIDGTPTLLVIDGQTRHGALLEHGLGEWVVDVKVHLDIHDNAQASALFLKLNDRAAVAPFDKFRNAVTAGVSAAVAADRLVRVHGLEITSGSRDGQICCVSVLQKLAAKSVLGSVLDTVIQAWGRTAAAVEGRVLDGLGLIFSTYKEQVDMAVLIKKLAKYPGGASALIGDGKGLHVHRKTSLSRCIAEQIRETYNSGRRSGQLAPL